MRWGKNNYVQCEGARFEILSKFLASIFKFIIINSTCWSGSKNNHINYLNLLISFSRKYNVITLLKLAVIIIFVVFISKQIYNRYTYSFESLVEKKQMKMLKEINNILDIQKQ